MKQEQFDLDRENPPSKHQDVHLKWFYLIQSQVHVWKIHSVIYKFFLFSCHKLLPSHRQEVREWKVWGMYLHSVSEFSKLVLSFSWLVVFIAEN